MLLKLTAQEEPTNIYVQTKNIVAFRTCNGGAEIATNNSELQPIVTGKQIGRAHV